MATPEARKKGHPKKKTDAGQVKLSPTRLTPGLSTIMIRLLRHRKGVRTHPTRWLGILLGILLFASSARAEMHIEEETTLGRLTKRADLILTAHLERVEGTIFSARPTGVLLGSAPERLLVSLPSNVRPAPDRPVLLFLGPPTERAAVGPRRVIGGPAGVVSGRLLDTVRPLVAAREASPVTWGRALLRGFDAPGIRAERDAVFELLRLDDEALARLHPQIGKRWLAAVERRSPDYARPWLRLLARVGDKSQSRALLRGIASGTLPSGPVTARALHACGGSETLLEAIPKKRIPTCRCTETLCPVAARIGVAVHLAGPSLNEHLVGWLDVPCPQIRLAAIEGLGIRRATASIPTLMERLPDLSRLERRAILSTLLNMEGAGYRALARAEKKATGELKTDIHNLRRAPERTRQKWQATSQ